MFGKLEPENLAEWILADHLVCRLHLQLHKYIWGPEARGGLEADQMAESKGKAVVLLSGGLDSTTVAAIARSGGYDVFGLSFRSTDSATRWNWKRLGE